MKKVRKKRSKVLRMVSSSSLRLFPAFMLSASLIGPLPVNGQKPPAKFGKIDKSALEMKSYAPDTTADAVVLCKYGEFNPNNFTFRWFTRIKILKKEGFDRASTVVPGYARSDVRGVTYNLVNGKIVTTKLDKESIFRERVTEKSFRLRVAMPNINTGSVFDLEFSLPGTPLEWTFQDEIPVALNELRLPQGTIVTLSLHFSGYEPFSEVSSWRWVARDVPAFKPEPYSNDPSNYLSKLEIEIANVNLPGYMGDFTTSWSSVNQQLRKHENFGGNTSGYFLYLNDAVDEINEACKTDHEKMVMACEKVREQVKWDENHSVVSSSDLAYVWNRKHLGSSADLNFLLYQLLSKLDFEVQPVVLSTRSNGMINTSFPTLRKFNHMIVRGMVEGEKVLLDVTGKFEPAGLLPEECINGQGFIMNDYEGEFVDLTSGGTDTKAVFCKVGLDEDGMLDGIVSYKRSSYAASRFRSEYDRFNSESEYIKHFEEKNKGVMVRDLEIENLDSIYLPVKDNYQVFITSGITEMEDRIFVKPILFEKTGENPFKKKERTYPVDFICPKKLYYNLQFMLPDGYTVEKIPDPMRAALPDGSAMILYGSNTVGNMVNIMYQVRIKRPIYYQTEYQNLKMFFTTMLNKEAEMIIINKAGNEQ